MVKIFIIHSLGLTKQAVEYAEELEAHGHETYVPGRDTDQTTVSTILASNRAGMEWSDEVHLIWDLSSLGSVFDLGMAYALRKPTYIRYVKKHHWTKVIAGSEGGYMFRDGEYVPLGGPGLIHEKEKTH